MDVPPEKRNGRDYALDARAVRTARCFGGDERTRKRDG
jgi:hypothetical protein